MQAERLQLVVADHATNAHWCVDGVVVKSDWVGAQSLLTEDVPALLDGLDEEVATHIREFTRQLV